MWCRGHSIHTVIDLIGLSPLLIDKDYRDKDDDLCHDAKKGPESSQATADTQVDFVSSYAEVVTSRANVVPEVTVDVQVVNGQTGLVGGILDLIFDSSIGDTLRVIFKKQVSNKAVNLLQNKNKQKKPNPKPVSFTVKLSQNYAPFSELEYDHIYSETLRLLMIMRVFFFLNIIVMLRYAL